MKKKAVFLSLSDEQIETLREKFVVSEIVTCKDCKYWWRENELCTHPKSMNGIVCCLECGPGFFCGRGEKKPT